MLIQISKCFTSDEQASIEPIVQYTSAEQVRGRLSTKKNDLTTAQQQQVLTNLFIYI